MNRWVVAFACAWINLFIFAVFRSAGVLYLSIVSTFGCSYQQAAWPVSLAGSVASLIGLAAGLLAHYFPLRLLIIVGVGLCSASLAATYFAASVQTVVLTVGLLQGVGIGFVTNLLPAVLSAHFAEKRSIALGISYAGATLGAFVFPVLIQSLLDWYAFHGTMLLLGGLVLNGIAGGLLLKMPKTEKKSIKRGKSPEEASRSRAEETAIIAEQDKKKDHQQQNHPQQQQFTLEPLIGAECDTIVYVDTNQVYDSISGKERRQTPTSSFSRSVSPGEMDRSAHNSFRKAGRPKTATITSLKSFGDCDDQVEEDTVKTASGPLLSRIYLNLRRDLRLLVDVHFVICTFTYISFILDFVAFIIILPDVAREAHIDGNFFTLCSSVYLISISISTHPPTEQYSKWLLSIFSLTDFLGRLAPGWASHWGLITDKATYVLSITAMGGCMLALNYAATWMHFVAVALVCGLATGAQMVLSPAILADYLGAENTAVAFGAANFLCGLFTLVTRPLIIGVKDVAGNYQLLGYVLSGSALLSSALWAVEILCSRK